MKGQKRIRDYGIIIGEMKTGKRNAITDVRGVKVGHVTLNDGPVKTGVTAVLPHEGNLYKEKVVAACHVINGYGKTTGTIQIEELGTIETPILLTNTLSVGTAYDALVRYMLEGNDDIGVTTGSVNPITCECNDSYLNDIRGLHIETEDIYNALNKADYDFEEGAVGAGTGMSCYGLKGGIGSASRIIEVEGEAFTVGILALTNFGRKEDFLLDGFKAGKIIAKRDKREEEQEKGSIIILLATDIPMTSRQLKRISKRVIIGLNRTGSYMGNGSGEVVIGFTTANKVLHYEKSPMVSFNVFNENGIDDIFKAVGEATEEAILNSMICAESTIGRDDHERKSLKEYIDFLE